MKFLAFVDMHQDLQDFALLRHKIEQHKDIQFIICLGDFTFFGHNMPELMELLDHLGKKIYLIHGNHEHEDDLEELAKKFDNIEFAHKKIIFVEDIALVFFGGGGFSHREPEFKAFVKKYDKKLRLAKKIVLATHPPPHKTALDEVAPGWNVGVKDFRDFITEYKPILAISGHIHESYKRKQVLEKTVLVNPGGDGEIFEI